MPEPAKACISYAYPIFHLQSPLKMFLLLTKFYYCKRTFVVNTVCKLIFKQFFLFQDTK